MVEKNTAPQGQAEPKVPEIPDKPQTATSAEQAKPETPKMPKDIEIGFHQGAITTLVNERNELLKMAQTVEVIMQSHVKRLEELGVKVTRKQ